MGFSLQVDLAKENLHLLNYVREIGEKSKESSGFEYAYVNVNCALFMKKNGNHERFNSLDEAKQLLGLITTGDDTFSQDEY